MPPETLPESPTASLVRSHPVLLVLGLCGAALIVALLVALTHHGLSDLPIPGLTHKVPGGYGCPTVRQTTVKDFPRQPVSWVQAATVPGTQTPVFVPAGARAVSPEDVTRLGLDKITKSAAIQDPASFKIYYQENLNMYGVDRYHAYYIHAPKKSDASNGSQVVSVIPDADPATFAPTKYLYFSTDATHVYYLGMVVPDATPQNFAAIQNGGGVIQRADGTLELLDGEQHSITDADVLPTPLPMTGLEAFYVLKASGGTTTPGILFSDSIARANPSSTLSIRPLSPPDQKDMIRPFLPTILGVYTDEAGPPIACIVARDYLIRYPMPYKGHIILALDGRDLAMIDFTKVPLRVQHIALPGNDWSQLTYDDPLQSLLVLTDQGYMSEATTTSYSLLRVPYDTVISGSISGTTILSGQGHMEGLVLSHKGTTAAAVRSGPGDPFETDLDLVTIDLNAGTYRTIAHAGNWKSSFDPLFFSPDESTIFYQFIPYERFGGPSLHLYKHPLAAPAVLYGTDAEDTSVPTDYMVVSKDGARAYYLYGKQPHNSCWSAAEADFNDTLAVYDLSTGTTRDLYHVSTQGLDKLTVSTTTDNAVSVGVYDLKPTKIEGKTCNEFGDLVGTRTF